MKISFRREEKKNGINITTLNLNRLDNIYGESNLACILKCYHTKCQHL